MVLRPLLLGGEMEGSLGEGHLDLPDVAPPSGVGVAPKLSSLGTDDSPYDLDQFNVHVLSWVAAPRRAPVVDQSMGSRVRLGWPFLRGRNPRERTSSTPWR